MPAEAVTEKGRKSWSDGELVSGGDGEDGGGCEEEGSGACMPVVAAPSPSPSFLLSRSIDSHQHLASSPPIVCLAVCLCVSV